MVAEFRIAILGKTGNGKSKLGNSLLGSGIFKSSVLTSSMSLQCEIGEAQTSIGMLKVVDTPGLFDSAKPNGKTLTELVKCVGLLAPGPHVFILTLKCGNRFTPEELNTVELLTNIFGDGVMKHIILVFTAKDQLDDDDTTITEYLDNVPEYLKTLLRDVNERYEFICNRPKNSSHAQDVNNVLTLIKNTVQQNGGNYYTQEMIKGVEDVIQDEIREKQKRGKKSDEECRQEIQTEIVNNDQSIWSKIFDKVTKILEVTLPHLANIIIAYIGRKT